MIHGAGRSALASRLRGANRIHIIGAPGSGKSTLAESLGRTLRLPVHPLDSVAYEGPDFVERPADLCAREAQTIAETSRWISEGIFVGWVDPLLERADVIIFLDYLTWRSAAARIVMRALRGAWHSAKTRKGTERFLRFGDYRRILGQVVFVLKESRNYWLQPTQASRYPVTHAQVQNALAPYGAKVVRITDSSQARSLETALGGTTTL